MAMTLDGSNGVTFNDASLQGAAASPYVLKNRIINGDFRIDQRNAGASSTPSAGDTYNLDRWRFQKSGSGTLTIQQVASTLAGFSSALKITVTGTSTPASTDYYTFGQVIEGYNIADLNLGTANNQPLTISFWIQSSVTGTYSASIFNTGSGVNGYPATFTITSANTWEYKTITITGATSAASGTWQTTNAGSLYFRIDIGSGSSFNGTANAWNSTGAFKTSSSVNLISNTSATLSITGVQLEIGTSATPFERRLYDKELISCQRYYQAQIIDIGNAAILSGNVTNGVSYYGSKTLQVAMRAAPTLTWGTQWGVNGFAASAPTADWLGADGFRFYKAANSTTNGGYIFQAWTASAEI
jgi:hypothetical protein